MTPIPLSSGHIAKIVGMPRHSRHVGQGRLELCFLYCDVLDISSVALKFLPDETDIPWHRVIASSGTISSRGPGTSGADRQRVALLAEDVQVNTPGPGGGLMRVSLAEYGWFPDPSQVGLDLDAA